MNYIKLTNTAGKPLWFNAENILAFGPIADGFTRDPDAASWVQTAPDCEYVVQEFPETIELKLVSAGAKIVP